MEFKISQQMTKAKIIDEYHRLLDAYKKRVTEVEEAGRQRAEAEERLRSEAGRVAREATVEGVIESVGQLRGQIAKTLNDLLDRMSARAEELESLNRAIEVRQERLQELHDIEAAADTFAKLVRSYEERRAATEQQFAERLAEMEAEHAQKARAFEEEYSRKAQSLDASHKQAKEALEKEMEAMRQSWADEKARARAQLQEAAEEREKARQREEADYVYNRDRARKLEEHEQEERRAALEKQLRERAEAVERDIAERTAAVATREEELEELRRQVAELPERLGAEGERVAREARGAATQEAEHKSALVAMERQWEVKVLQERIRHLEENLKARDEKLQELKAELSEAQKQVQHIAEKTVEGASLTKAFQTVNQIALEQARRPEIKKGE